MKIGILYSYGAQFNNAVNYIYNNYPTESIIIFLPMGYPTENLPVEERILLQFLPWDGSHLTYKKALLTLPKILKILRKFNLDMLVILFDSPRLIFLSKLTKAKSVYIYNSFNEFRLINKRLIPTLFFNLYKIAKGYITYLYIRCYTKIFKIESN